MRLDEVSARKIAVGRLALLKEDINAVSPYLGTRCGEFRFTQDGDMLVAVTWVPRRGQ